MQPFNQNNAHGIDVSHWQAYVPWDKVMVAGNSFSFLKATEGASGIDDNFVANVKGAKQNGLLTGAYHFLHAGTVDAAQAEAANFLRTIDGQPLDLPFVLDVEQEGNTPDAALAWLQKVEDATGKRPLIYSYPDFIRRVIGSSLSAYGLWYAFYNEGTTPQDIGGWSEWEFLQYSEKGRVPGINGYVDLNVYKGTVDDLMAAYGKPILDAGVANTVISTWVAPSWDAATSSEQQEYIHWLAEELRRAARILIPPTGWTFTADVANTVINTWVGSDWSKTESQEQKDYDHWLANQLRVASGQPIQ